MKDWLRLRAALEAAIDAPEAELHGILDEHCGDDRELWAKVLGVLAHDAARDTLLDADPDSFAIALRSAVEELAPGTRLGPWIVREPIASGGMGTVYRAERADGSFDKTVAIKLVKAGMDSAEVLARFENERRVLAELEHPGIARLLDAGSSPRGRPFLVMEYVEGTPIDAYCAERQLGVRGRVELICAVCDAVHVAHQALVVHRDLKPSNVLVTPDGTPKLLDFGIAKVLDPEGPTAVARTLGPSRVMTPAYASPEQCRGERVTTASDVYSLGVLLYELLAGRRPLDPEQPSAEAAVRIAPERQPRPPSTSFGEDWAESLGTQAPRLRERLAGDLDTIVLKALRDDPSRRYASAAQLAEDLRRHLSGLPVMARPDVWSYRASKFVRRHRTLVLAVSAAVLALCIGTVATWNQYRRANAASVKAKERFDDVSQLAQSFLFELDDILQDLEGATPARDFVVSTGLVYLDALSRDAAAEPALRRKVVRGYLKMGDLQGGPLVANLGRAEDAMASYERALVLAEGLGAEVAADLLVLCHHRIGVLHEHAGELFAARESFGRALEIGADASEELGQGTVFEALLHVQDSLVTSCQREGRFVEALAYAEELVRRVEYFASHVPEDRRRQLEAMSTTRLGVIQGLVGLPDEAETNLRAAVRSARSWRADRPHSSMPEGVLTFCLFNLAAHLQTRDALGECAEILGECVVIHRRQRASDPANDQAARDLVACLNVLTYVQPALGQYEEALVTAVEYLDVARQRIALHPTNLVAQRNVAAAQLATARALSLLGRHTEARVACLEAQDAFTELAASRPEDTEAQRDVAVASDELGRLHLRWSEALEDSALELEHRRAALEAFQVHLEVLSRLRAEDRLSPSDERWIEASEENVRRSEAAIALLVAAGEN